jgi:hypothetical protein
MPRKTAKEEVEAQFDKFFTETRTQLMYEITATRQPTRRSELLKEIDVLERVHGRFYNWVNGVNDAA